MRHAALAEGHPETDRYSRSAPHDSHLALASGHRRAPGPAPPAAPRRDDDDGNLCASPHQRSAPASERAARGSAAKTCRGHADRRKSGKGRAGSSGNRLKNPALGMGRGTGFEPVAFGSGVGTSPLVPISESLQTLVISQRRDGSAPSSSLDLAPVSSPRVTPGLQTRRVELGPHERLLPVREVARRLSVSRATVYRLCAKGDLPHVRVANSILVWPGEILGSERDKPAGA